MTSFSIKKSGPYKWALEYPLTNPPPKIKTITAFLTGLVKSVWRSKQNCVIFALHVFQIIKYLREEWRCSSKDNLPILSSSNYTGHIEYKQALRSPCPLRWPIFSLQLEARMRYKILLLYDKIIKTKKEIRNHWIIVYYAKERKISCMLECRVCGPRWWWENFHHSIWAVKKTHCAACGKQLIFARISDGNTLPHTFHINISS